MNKEEIFRHINVGRSKSICVDRRLIQKYPGIVRNITIREGAELQIDFLDKNILELDEGEMTIYFYYENYDKLFDALEKFTGNKISEWENYTQTGWYPNFEEVSLEQSWTKFKIDFANKILPLPDGYKEYLVRGMYWKALDSGEIKPSDSEEVFFEWQRRKMIEEEEVYTED